LVAFLFVSQLRLCKILNFLNYIQSNRGDIIFIVYSILSDAIDLINWCISNNFTEVSQKAFKFFNVSTFFMRLVSVKLMSFIIELFKNGENMLHNFKIVIIKYIPSLRLLSYRFIIFGDHVVWFYSIIRVLHCKNFTKRYKHCLSFVIKSPSHKSKWFLFIFKICPTFLKTWIFNQTNYSFCRYNYHQRKQIQLSCSVKN